MPPSTSGVRRLFVTYAIMLVWLMLLAAFHALATQNYWQGALALLIPVLVVLAARSNALRERLATTPFSRTGLLVAAFAAFIVVVYEASNLRFTSPYLLGELYLPSVVLIVRAVGSIALALIVLLEIAQLMRARA